MNIQQFCKSFRENTLKMTLKQVGEISGTDFKTISSFEHGRSNNLNHLDVYIKCCRTMEELHLFSNGISHVLTSKMDTKVLEIMSKKNDVYESTNNEIKRMREELNRLEKLIND